MDGRYGRDNNEPNERELDPRDRYPESRSLSGRGGQADSRHTPSGLSPWRGVWMHPRLVTRDFIYSARPLRGALLLALIASMFGALNTASTRNWGDDMSLPMLVLSVMVTGLISGLVTYYVVSWLFKLVGGWLGGVGSSKDMRIVVGRISGMLGIMIGLLWIPELLIAGRENFTFETPNLDSSTLRSLLYMGVLLLEFAFGFWAFVLILHATGEAHAFSAWRALLMYFILGVLLLLVLVAVVLVVALVSGTALGM